MGRDFFQKKVKLSGAPCGAAAGAAAGAASCERSAGNGGSSAPYPAAELKNSALSAAFEKAMTAEGGAWLWLTDDPEAGRQLAAEGACVLFLLRPGRSGGFCPEADWCLQVPEGVEARAALEGIGPDQAGWPDWLPLSFLWQVWLRGRGLPWHICETERLCLRELMETDLDFLYRCAQDPASARFVAGPSADREAAQKKLSAYRRQMYGFYGFGLWLILEKESGRPAGRAGLQLREGYETPELGYEIEASCRGQGYAREALEAVIAYAGEQLELSCLRAVVDEENAASRRLCEKLGFSVEKTAEEAGHLWIHYSRRLAGVSLRSEHSLF